MRGVLWYQGESNAYTFGDRYASSFQALIEDWRAVWNRPELPFLFVQLPEYDHPQSQPVEDAYWARIRAAQASVAKAVPFVSMAPALGLGDEDNVHPLNKRDVALRLAACARSLVYGEKGVVCMGPQFDELTTGTASLRVRFRWAEGGLRPASGDALKGFAIAGKDRKFVWADARIEKDRVTLSSPQVPEPCHAAYGWSDNPQGNLVNGAGLPASPFRTGSCWLLFPKELLGPKPFFLWDGSILSHNLYM